jgi:hypothetical protein
MSVLRDERRTLPVLITLGVLLGAGLALASPAGHRAPRRSPSPAVSVSPTRSASPAAAAPSPHAETSGGSDRACTPVEPVPGWAAGHGSLAHAIRVLASSCSDDHGKGLQTAMSHLAGNAKDHRPPADHAGGKDTHGTGAGGGAGTATGGPSGPGRSSNEHGNGGKRPVGPAAATRPNAG